MINSTTTTNIYSQIHNFLRKNKTIVLATVTGSGGSTPQKPGSSALYGPSGLITGTVGGGTVELTVQKKAKEAVLNKKSEYLQFDLTNEIADENGPICGGKMNILLDADPSKNIDVFSNLNKALENQVPGLLITMAKPGIQRNLSIKRYFFTAENLAEISALHDEEALIMASELLKNPGRNNFMELKRQKPEKTEEQLLFFETIIPLPRLFIAGAGHVGKALSHLGKLLGFEVWVWDDRPEYANQKNLPDADKILTGKINDSLNVISPDKDTYIVIVTRDHQNDSDVLKTFIGSNAGYIGMMGSKRKIAQVKDLFINEGITTPDVWNKIYTPIGIDIHSKTVQEIAVSIAAQLVQVKHKVNSPHE